MAFLIGAGGHGKVVAEILQLDRPDLRVLDSDPRKVGSLLLGRPVESEPDVLDVLTGSVEFFVAIGDARARREITDTWIDRGHRLLVAVHTAAVVSPSALLEPGVCVMARAVIQADCRIGAGAIINTGATVDHDCRIGQDAHVAPGAHLAGGVTVGDAAWIGIGSAVIDGLEIGAQTVVGAGSVVVRSLPPGVVAYGCPCRVRSERGSPTPTSQRPISKVQV